MDDSVVQTISDTIYISNLSKDVTEEKLAEKFGGLGMLKIDRKTQKPKSKLKINTKWNLNVISNVEIEIRLFIFNIFYSMDILR